MKYLLYVINNEGTMLTEVAIPTPVVRRYIHVYHGLTNSDEQSILMTNDLAHPEQDDAIFDTTFEVIGTPLRIDGAQHLMYHEVDK